MAQRRGGQRRQRLVLAATAGGPRKGMQETNTEDQAGCGLVTISVFSCNSSDSMVYRHSTPWQGRKPLIRTNVDCDGDSGPSTSISNSPVSNFSRLREATSLALKTAFTLSLVFTSTSFKLAAFLMLLPVRYGLELEYEPILPRNAVFCGAQLESETGWSVLPEECIRRPQVLEQLGLDVGGFSNINPLARIRESIDARA
ncbi:MAG: hypothetical protein LAP87_28910 [Acidobacteriia bacterium]|nr:hypothetical protein [Terriglobia bacterium]